MSRKYLLGVSHIEGEESNALETLAKCAKSGDVVAIELEPHIALVIDVVLRNSNNSDFALREMLDDCNISFNYYWGNLMRLNYLKNLGLKFMPMENKVALEKGLVKFKEVERRGFENLSKRKIDEFIEQYVFGREKAFGIAIRKEKPNGIIVGSEHVDYFLKYFPEYSLVYRYNGDLLSPKYVRDRTKLLRKRQNM